MRFYYKSACLLWHSRSADHDIDRLACVVIRRKKFGTDKRGFMHAYPFLRVTNVIASNCDTSYVAFFAF